jgi:hypothetical protein
MAAIAHRTVTAAVQLRPTMIDAGDDFLGVRPMAV